MIQITPRPLSELLPKTEPGEGREPIPGFYAEYRGKVYMVKAVLERTAVLQDTENFYERRLGKLTEVFVDPAVVQWRTDTGGRFTDGGQPEPAARSRLRGRAASLTSKAKNKEARERGNLASRQPANQGQRRFNRHLMGPVTEQDQLRARGQSRCARCTDIFDRTPGRSNNSYCRLCTNHFGRERAKKKRLEKSA